MIKKNLLDFQSESTEKPTEKPPENKNLTDFFKKEPKKILNKFYKIPSDIRLHPKEYIKYVESKYENNKNVLELIKMYKFGNKKIDLEPEEPYILYTLWKYIHDMENKRRK